MSTLFKINNFRIFKHVCMLPTVHFVRNKHGYKAMLYRVHNNIIYRAFSHSSHTILYKQ